MKMCPLDHTVKANHPIGRWRVAQAGTTPLSADGSCGMFSLRTGRGLMSLRKTCVGAFALFALTSVGQAADMQPVKAPGAVDQATGYVEVYTGWARTTTDFGDGSERFNGWALGGAGRGNYWVSPGMSVQVDAQAEGTSYDDHEGGHFSKSSYLVGSHWSWRNPQQYLF